MTHKHNRPLKNFLETKAENRRLARVTGKRKREIRLVALAKFRAFATELRIGNLMGERPIHFELKNIAFDEKKFPMLF